MVSLGSRIRDSFRFALSDPEWGRRYLSAGPWLLVPVLGYVALLGWQRRLYGVARRGETVLPRLEFGHDLALGWTPFANLLSLFLLPMAIAGGASLALNAAGLRLETFVDRDVASTLLAIWVILARPVVLRHAFEGGGVAIVQPFRAVRSIEGSFGSYAATVVASFVALVAGLAGLNALCIGVIVTLPLGHAVEAHVLGSWQREGTERARQE